MNDDLARQPLRRLHPLTPLAKGARVFGIVGAVISYQSYQSLRHLSVGWVVWVSAALLVVIGGAFLISWVSWRYTGFRLTDEQLVVVEGVFARRTRTVPLARVQAVDVVRPLIARLLGLAEVRLEVVGGGKTEAPLAYLSASEAQRVRGQLLAVAARTQSTHAQAVSADASPEDDSDLPPAGVEALASARPGNELYAVPRNRLLLSQLLTGQVLMLPAITVPSVVIALTADGLTTAGLFGAASAVIGLGTQVVRRLTGEWGFQVVDGSDGLRMHRGLLETRAQTVPSGRVQAVRIRRPLLWLPFGWLRVEVDVAGYAPSSEQAAEQSGVLLPVATADEVTAVLRQVLPGVDVSSARLEPVPAGARWRAPVAALRLAVGRLDDVVVLRSGRLTEIITVVPYARLQSVRVVQGPWQRALGLASVAVDTAGRQITAVAEHRRDTDADALAAALARQAVQAAS